MRKISRFRESVTLVCFVLLLSLVVAKVERGDDREFTGELRAVDGDSLSHGKERLRLSGIDAPELSQVCFRHSRPWDCGREAKSSLAHLLSEGNLSCVGSRRDKYHRLLVTCRSGEVDINRTQVLNGMAISFGAYEKEERQARESGKGIWSGDFVAPAEWRARHGSGTVREAPHFMKLF